MNEILTDVGDQIVGKRIFARFRKNDPPKNPIEIKHEDGSTEKSYKLINSVLCVIEKPFRKKES